MQQNEVTRYNRCSQIQGLTGWKALHPKCVASRHPAYNRRAPARQHVEGWDIDCWMLQVEPKKKSSWNQQRLFFCCQDARTTPPWQASGNAKTCYDQKGKLQGFKARVFQGQEAYDQETIWNNVASQILIEKEDTEVELWWEFIISGENSQVTSGSTGFGDRPAN